MEIEYDEQKRQACLADRGLDFEDAREVLLSVPRVTVTDTRHEYGEKRQITMGYANGRLLIVVHTQRGETTRIISMRKANEREQKNFANQLEQG